MYVVGRDSSASLQKKPISFRSHLHIHSAAKTHHKRIKHPILIQKLLHIVLITVTSTSLAANPKSPAEPAFMPYLILHLRLFEQIPNSVEVSFLEIPSVEE